MNQQQQNIPSSSSMEAISLSTTATTTTSTADPPTPTPTSEDISAATTTTIAGGGQESTITIERRTDFSAICKWTITNFPKIKGRALWSKYFEIGGYDCRLLVYPKGDSQALPGYISIYLQIVSPSNSSRWECFTSYRLSLVNVVDDSKSVNRDSWHRFSSKKKSHGWCDFSPSNVVLDSKLGFVFGGDNVLIMADLLILNETVSFVRDCSSNNCVNVANNSSNNSNNNNNSDVQCGGGGGGGGMDVLSGKFTWKVHNFSLFKEMIKTQKIMSPVFQAGECNLRISVYQSTVNGVEYLSMCLESKDTEKSNGGTTMVVAGERSCWCLFRMSVLNQKPGLNHMQRDSYGRFAADNKSGDNTSLGWNDYMKMSDFVGPEAGFLVDDTAVFSTSFHVIKEFSSFSKSGTSLGARVGNGGSRKSDGHSGKFTWSIDNFTRLKDLLKKRKITGLCIKSRRFQLGNRDCRLIVYPRGMLMLVSSYDMSTSIMLVCFCLIETFTVYKLCLKILFKNSHNRFFLELLICSSLMLMCLCLSSLCALMKNFGNYNVFGLKEMKRKDGGKWR